MKKVRPPTIIVVLLIFTIMACNLGSYTLVKNTPEPQNPGAAPVLPTGQEPNVPRVEIPLIQQNPVVPENSNTSQRELSSAEAQTFLNNAFLEPQGQGLLVWAR
jgi:hypothetical protein